MRRGKPPTRKTPLRAKSAPKAGRVAGPTREVVEAVYERENWSCARCGFGVGPVRGVDHHVHHRRLKGRGGTDKPDAHLPQNLLLLCPDCHGYVHGPGRAEMEDNGWIVPSTGDPAESCVLLADGRLRYLALDGTYALHPPRWKGDVS